MKDAVGELTLLVDQVRVIDNSDQLLSTLERISTIGTDESKMRLKIGDYKSALKLEELVATAYNDAAEKVDTNSSLNDLKTIVKVFRGTARNWEDRSESDKNEYITRYIEKSADSLRKKLRGSFKVSGRGLGIRWF